MEKRNNNLKSDEKIIENDGIQVLLKAQEDFLVNNYADKDNLIFDNKKLNDEISRLTRTIMLDNNYIDYLLNSFWWKMTFPFRFISRKFRNRVQNDGYIYVESLPLNKKTISITEKVSIIIFTYNAGEMFTLQLNNLVNQKLIDNLEIVVIDRGSQDNTLKYAKKFKCKVVSIDEPDLSNDEIYARCLPNITGKYVVMIDQNKIVDSKYWIYQSIRPIMDGKAVSTVFFNQDIRSIREISYYNELKARMTTIAGEQVLFFPFNRDIIQYLSPIVLDKSCVLVKKKISNIFLI